MLEPATAVPMNVPAVSMTTQASVKPARPVRPSFTVVSTEPHIAAFWCGLLPPRVHGDADTSQVLFTGQQADSFQCDAGSGCKGPTRSGRAGITQAGRAAGRLQFCECAALGNEMPG